LRKSKSWQPLEFEPHTDARRRVALNLRTRGPEQEDLGCRNSSGSTDGSCE
jgi:hypothetical protein